MRRHELHVLLKAFCAGSAMTLAPTVQSSLSTALDSEPLVPSENFDQTVCTFVIDVQAYGRCYRR